MITYDYFSERRFNTETGYYDTYGLSVRVGSDEVIYIRDITTDPDRIASLKDAFNACRLEPEHIDEAIENFLYDFEV